MIKITKYFCHILLILGFSYSEKSKSEIPLEIHARYVGAETCAHCHKNEYQQWQGSHHELAMQEVSELTVLADFNNTKFNYYGSVTKFYRRDTRFFVLTDGPDGALNEYEVSFVFGVYPLQQYLVEFPGGRFQVLSIAWDTRSKHEGGQRWFHLYPDQHIQYNDELHWTNASHNWNFMCADCHSTNVNKGYDFATNTYSTQWSEIHVSCEACHGPGSGHISWANKKIKPNDPFFGFDMLLNERNNARWVIEKDANNAKRIPVKRTNLEIDTCAQCHSRRVAIQHGARPGDTLLDNFHIDVLTQELYHADGQIKGEVYEYASFLQSKMYHAGVTCSDCHSPHTLKLKVDGNQLCAQCHSAERYNSKSHHLHELTTKGAECIECHMPSKVYMQIDSRRDHSFRVPRPDLSDKIKSPNACKQCHNESNRWLAKNLSDVYGDPPPHYGEAIFAGRNKTKNAKALLENLLSNTAAPAIVKATAIELYTPYVTHQSSLQLEKQISSNNSLISFSLANNLHKLPDEIGRPIAIKQLYSDAAVTRALSARNLLAVPQDTFPPNLKLLVEKELDNYRAMQLFNSDRAESLINLANIALQQKQVTQVESLLIRAITINPFYSPGYVNLADFYRGAGDEKQCETVLREGLTRVHDKTIIQHVLGLSLARQKRLDEAIFYLKQAAESDTTSAYFIYVYAVALHSQGELNKALNVLKEGTKQFPNESTLQHALDTMLIDFGHRQP